MFRNNYDVTNKSYLKSVQKGSKVNKESEPKENKPPRNKKETDKKQENRKDNSKKPPGQSDKGNNVDFYA